MSYKTSSTLEEFVISELRAKKTMNVTFFTKDKLFQMYQELYPAKNAKVYSMSKDFLVDEILKKRAPLDIYEEFKDITFGINPIDWMDKFHLTAIHRKRMEEAGFLLHVIFYSYERVSMSKYANVPYYRAEDYFKYTVEEVEKWKVDNIKGYKRRKIIRENRVLSLNN